MLLVSDNLLKLERFEDWADERFAAVKIDERSNRKDRALYLRHDAYSEQARAALLAVLPGLTPLDGELAGEMRVRGYALDAAVVRAGRTVMLTVEWEASDSIDVDCHQVTFVRDREGQVVR
ncbi:MAG: hypothetical protein M3O34_07910 [Chloroflexota bacterium]|nr:hypothetical protein [Chloroflexota bacterium]